MTKYSTLSSISFTLYRKNFLEDKNSFVHQLTGEIENNIRTSYTGGAVDMYIPSFEVKSKGDYLYAYDVNSLYPSVMLDKPMPVVYS